MPIARTTATIRISITGLRLVRFMFAYPPNCGRSGSRETSGLRIANVGPKGSFYESAKQPGHLLKAPQTHRTWRLMLTVLHEAFRDADALTPSSYHVCQDGQT